MHRFLSVRPSVHPFVTRQKLLDSIAPRVVKFGQGMGGDDLYVDLEGRGHRSKVKVARSKNVILGIKSIYIQ